MNNKSISARVVFFAALAVCTHQAMAQSQSTGDASAQAAAAAPATAAVQRTVPTGGAAGSAAAPVGSLRLVDQENAGRDAQGHMRIQLINGGIKLPAKL